MQIKSWVVGKFRVNMVVSMMLTGLFYHHGCTTADPTYCESDEECQRSDREGYNPTQPHCHMVKHLCYEGCKTDQECQDPTEEWYISGYSVCSQTTHECTASSDAGMHSDLDHFKSDKQIQEDSQTGNQQDSRPTSADAGVDAVGKSDLPVKDFGTRDTLRKLLRGSTCGKGEQCQDGYCVDGVCCENACGETCKACNLPGKLGSCQFIPASAGLSSECPGDALCGNGVCNGQGQCAYPKTGSECKKTCGKGQQINFKCDSTHRCFAAVTTSCGFHQCNTTTNTCFDGCIDHSHCVQGSVCDRSEAHVTGKGKCVDPQKVVTVGPEEKIFKALDRITPEKFYLAIPPRASIDWYDSVELTKSVFLVGLSIAGTDKPTIIGIQTRDNTVVTVQGLTVHSVGIHCQPVNGRATLTAIENNISASVVQGVSAKNCDVTLKRNIINSNTEGGLQLINGTFIIDNNQIVNNGRSYIYEGVGSDIGGALIEPGAGGKVSFVNNTVVDNKTKIGGNPGIICNGDFTIFNSIFWHNFTYGSESDIPIKGCFFSASNVERFDVGSIIYYRYRDPKLDNKFRPQAAECINKGLNSAPGIGLLDLGGSPRIQGGTVDLGAYEVK